MQRRHWGTFPFGALISIALAAVVFAGIWMPELSHWYVRPAAISNSLLQAARRAPERRILDEVAAMQAQGFSWGMHGVAPEVLSALDAMLPDALKTRLPAARAAFAARSERVWGTARAGAARTPIPDFVE